MQVKLVIIKHLCLAKLSGKNTKNTPKNPPLNLVTHVPPSYLQGTVDWRCSCRVRRTAAGVSFEKCHWSEFFKISRKAKSQELFRELKMEKKKQKFHLSTNNHPFLFSRNMSFREGNYLLLLDGFFFTASGRRTHTDSSILDSRWDVTVDGSGIRRAPVEVGSLSQWLQGKFLIPINIKAIWKSRPKFHPDLVRNFPTNPPHKKKDTPSMMQTCIHVGYNIYT